MIEAILIIATILTLVVGVAGVLAWKGWLPNIATHQGRQAWALLALLGGCVVFTIFAAVGVWLVSKNITYTFYLALAAHAQILVGISTLGALLVRRSVKVGKDGIEFTDHEIRAEFEKTTTTTTTKTN